MVELSHKPLIRAYRMDCIEFMADLPDKAYELGMVDPEYGIGGSAGAGEYSRGYLGNIDKKWDLTPCKPEYFAELRRVTENQIIWGGNYFHLPHSRGWVCWYKTDEIKGRDFSEIELAYTSFDRPARHFEYKPFIRNGTRIHPTQKPVSLYRWLLANYAKPGQTILDTHGGSFSSAIACWHEGYDMDIVEIDEEYFEAACKRFERETRQQKLFPGSGGGVR